MLEAVNFHLFKPLNKKRDALGWIGWSKKVELVNEHQMKDLANELGLRLVVAKTVPFSKMNEFYNQCVAFVSLPPSYAGFNLCWLEAMAAGVPFVYGNNFGVGECLSSIKKIDSLNDVKTLPLKTIDHRKWLLKNDFTWERHVLNLLRIFNESLS